jgi:hypothetical protein
LRVCNRSLLRTAVLSVAVLVGSAGSAEAAPFTGTNADVLNACNVKTPIVFSPPTAVATVKYSLGQLGKVVQVNVYTFTDPTGETGGMAVVGASILSYMAPAGCFAFGGGMIDTTAGFQQLGIPSAAAQSLASQL